MRRTSFIFAFIIAAFSFSIAYAAETTSSGNAITFPVTELDNCASKSECRDYCNQTEHMDACIEFAKAHGLWKEEVIAQAKLFAQAIKDGNGPGDCSNPVECKTYCADKEHHEECLAFAEKYRIFDKDRVQLIRKIKNFIDKKDGLPGNCKDAESCKAYCATTAHADACLTFAAKAGTIAAEKLEKARELIKVLQTKETPGKCQSREECMTYCADTAHADECAAFSTKHELLNEVETKIFKETGGKGPGGCVGQDCKEFCQQPENKQACIEFGQRINTIRKTLNSSGESTEGNSASSSAGTVRTTKPQTTEQLKLQQELEKKKRLQLEFQKSDAAEKTLIPQRKLIPTHQFAPQTSPSATIGSPFLGALIRFLFGF